MNFPATSSGSAGAGAYVTGLPVTVITGLLVVVFEKAQMDRFLTNVLQFRAPGSVRTQPHSGLLKRMAKAMLSSLFMQAHL